MKIEEIIKYIIGNDLLHARWLNSLSYLENCGARKIAKGQHPLAVQEERLKHAAEEFRHAYHLKKQIHKLNVEVPEDYRAEHLLAPKETIPYLNRLDLACCRYLKPKMETKEIKAYAYLLVTYAIEVRAAKLYPIYDKLLKESDSPVSVRSILLEEKEHLHEMEVALANYPFGPRDGAILCKLESALFTQWLTALGQIAR